MGAGTSFNRYMVECESKRLYYFINNLKVLIDTWWNVNRSISIVPNNRNPVLIDTWWNVNCGILYLERIIPSFNRYMVECEFGSGSQIGDQIASFNRYMVECEC